METRKVSTGIEGLDRILGGGFERGSTILVAGHPGAGKSTLAAQFLYSGMLEGEAGVYVNFSERRQDFYRHMLRLGFDFKAMEEKGLMKYISSLTPIGEGGIEADVRAVMEAIKEIGAKRLVVDSVNALAAIYSEGKARSFLHMLINVGLKATGVTSLLVAELPYGSDTIGMGFEEFVVDAVIVLRAEEIRGITRRLLEIRKVRWADVPRISYEFVIERGGIDLYVPYEYGYRGGFSKKRISTGIAGLDAMLHGGLLKASSVLVAGPSGSGKTMLALSFAASGAVMGERVLYISFEEPADQLLAVLSDMGVCLDDLRENLKIHSLSPRRYTPGALFHFFKEHFTAFKPSRVVLDGLSALERQYGGEAFLELAHSISMMCKSQGATLLMTSIADVMGGEQTLVSTIADTVIALWLDKAGEEIIRRIAVIKARGTDHDRRKRYLVIREGRVVVD